MKTSRSMAWLKLDNTIFTLKAMGEIEGEPELSQRIKDSIVQLEEMKTILNDKLNAGMTPREAYQYYMETGDDLGC